MTQLEKILEKCESMFSPWDDDLSNNHGWVNNDEIMPIIRELCAVIEEQQKALSEMIEAHERTTPRPKSSISFKMKFINAKDCLDSTTKRLARLAE